MFESLLFPKLNTQKFSVASDEHLDESFWNGNEPVLFFKMSVTKDDEQCLMVANMVFEHYWLYHYII